LGTPFQSHCPNKASQILVKIREFGTPPLERMKARALDIYTSSEECPANFKAK